MLRFLPFLILGSIPHALLADERDARIEELKDAYARLDGFSASYRSTTETGKVAVFKHGAHFESGWAYAMVEGRDQRGQLVMNLEQWTTDDGKFVMKSDDQAIVFDGFTQVIQRFESLIRAVEGTRERSMRVQPICNLTSTEASVSIGASNHAPEWLKDLGELSKVDEASVVFTKDDIETVVISRESGLMLSKTIKVGGGVREMKLTEWKRNPDQETIQKGMTIDLNKAETQDIAVTGVAKKMLYSFYQDFIRRSDQIDKLEEDLPEFLKKCEEGTTDYLRREPLNGNGFITREALFEAFDQVINELSAEAENKNEDINFRQELAKNLKARQDLASNLAHALTNQTPENKRTPQLLDALGNRLKAQGEKQDRVLKAVETVVLRSYYRVRIERGLDQYLGL